MTALALLHGPLLLLAGLQTPSTDAPFPPSTPIAEGVSPDAVQRLEELVEGIVDDEDAVGAELLLVVNGKAILHRGFGWRDREAEVPMGTGNVFCVRSMTKPLVGTAILMLIGEGKLDFGDRVAEYLPEFDVEGSRDITVEHLLRHESGLPLSLLLGADLHSLESIRAAARLGAGHPLSFEPGTSFQYSDQGTDTLTALIEVVADTTAAAFVEERILLPLGMDDSRCFLELDDPIRERAMPLYIGSAGHWSRFWNPDERSIFPFFLGSQGLYSTLENYALFMEFWRRRGRSRSERLLSSRLARKALEPGEHANLGSTGFPELLSSYGFQMQVWTRPEEGRRSDEVVAFGHSGSDGTHAWVFPDQNAMAFYFTQSRGSVAGLRVEDALAQIFLGAPFDPNEAAPDFEPYLGYYWEGEGDVYRAIVRDGDELALEILGRGAFALDYAGEDRWKMRSDPSKVLAFRRDEAGAITGYDIGTHREYRFEPSTDLPSPEELAELVRKTHRFDLVSELGPVRTRSSVSIEPLGIEGESTYLYAWPNRIRVDVDVGVEHETSAFDGSAVRFRSSQRPLTVAEGLQAELMRLDSAFVRYLDWARNFPVMTVIQRIQNRDGDVFLVRAGDTSAPGRTFYVSGATGMLIREDGLAYADMIGRIGQRITFADFRDVSGMQLPHRLRVEMANPMIGMVTTDVKVADVELGVSVAEGAFSLSE